MGRFHTPGTPFNHVTRKMIVNSKIPYSFQVILPGDGPTDGKQTSRAIVLTYLWQLNAYSFSDSTFYYESTTEKNKASNQVFRQWKILKVF